VGAGGPALLVTADPRLRDEVGRLAAASALRVEVLTAVDDVLPRWADAGVVLVGADLLEAAADLRPPSRPEVYVLTVGGDDGVYRHALALGAQGVVELPRAGAWLGDLLADLAEGRMRHARTVAVVAGSGGAGASVLAAALAQVAARDRPTTVVDLDPAGCGADRLLGLDDRDGLRWGQLADVQGRLSSRALRDALPGDDNLRVLAWDHADLDGTPPAAVVREVVAAAQRGSELVVLDLPRDLGTPGVADAARLADLLVVCARTAVLPVVAAGRTTAEVRSLGVPVGLVVRTGAGGVDPLDVADALGLPLLAEVPTRRRTEELLNLGLGPAATPRAPLARAARRVLGSLAAEAAA
jgi:secretion/DNA translocation related CpaE-like protein